MRCLAPVFLLLSLTPAAACETALLLTIDVSNSVDTAEYRLQTDGLADALRDTEIVETMVRDQVAVAVVQWSGVNDQIVSIPWERITDAGQAELLSQRARGMERAFVMSGTATAEALLFSLAQFDAVADCKRKVIDISTDGTANAGSDVRLVRSRAERAGVTVNGIAIESMGRTITNFLQGSVISRDGFVMTARMHLDYPAAIRAKILREISRVIG
jgi:Ca-activated chloride channel family protein